MHQSQSASLNHLPSPYNIQDQKKKQRKQNELQNQGEGTMTIYDIICWQEQINGKLLLHDPDRRSHRESKRQTHRQ